jgi:calcineurin-like phosphoesterase family protein
VIYFTADLHLGHANMLRPEYCNRPFSNVTEMDEILINNINQKVKKKKDELFILGDFAVNKCGNVVAKYRERINCKRVHLIMGNHDPSRKNMQPKKWLFNYFEIVSQMYIVIYEQVNAFFLCHYPLACSFPTKNWGGIHLYGHVHNNDIEFDQQRRMINVGVDKNNFFPLSAEEILEKFNK